MRKHSRLEALAVSIVAVGSAAADAFAANGTRYAFVGVRVFTASERGTIDDATVVVADGRIAAVGRSDQVEVPDDVTRVAGDGRTLIPGLFDLHVHLGGSSSRADRPSPASARLAAEQTIACGVTAVLDLNGDESIIFDLRELSRTSSGLPRIFAAGAAITAPGGHGTESGFPARILAGADAIEPLLASLAERRPDACKLMVDAGGWGGQPARPTLAPDLFVPLVAAARARGIRTVAHAVDVESCIGLVAAGVDAIAHLPFDRVTPDGMSALIECAAGSGVTIITTLTSFEALFRAVEPSWIDDPLTVRFVPPAVLAGFRDDAWRSRAAGSDLAVSFCDRFPTILADVAPLVQAGISILPGTDAGIPGVFHGVALHRELESLVRAGLDPAEVLANATIDAARFLDVDAELGSIETGKRADLVLVEGNPLRRIRDTRRIVMVLRDGVLVSRDSIAERIQAEPPARAGAADRSLFDFEGPEPPAHEVRTSRGDGEGRVQIVRDYGDENPSGFLRLSGSLPEDVSGRGSISLRLELPPDARDWSQHARIRFRVRSTERVEFRLVIASDVVRDGDDFGVRFVADPRWRTVEVPLEDLAQIGFGKRVRFESSRVIAVEFRTRVGFSGTFDLDVDDVAVGR